MAKGKHDYYFQIIHGGSPSRTYLPQAQAGLIHALAQKGYDRKILYAARKELAALESLQKQLPEMPAESIYVNLTDLFYKKMSHYRYDACDKAVYGKKYILSVPYQHQHELDSQKAHYRRHEHTDYV